MHTITARLHHPDAAALYQDCYCYSDHYVRGEPLVHQTTNVIHQLFGGRAPDVITISFSATGDPAWKDHDHPVAFLHHPTADTDGTGGTSYICDPVHPQALEDAWLNQQFEAEPLTVWLCEHLFDYFPVRPDSFFCQFKPA